MCYKSCDTCSHIRDLDNGLYTKCMVFSGDFMSIKRDYVYKYCGPDHDWAYWEPENKKSKKQNKLGILSRFVDFLF